MAKKAKAKGKAAGKKAAAKSKTEHNLPEWTLEEDVSLERLHPDPANARVHGDRNMQAIMGSLRQWGQVEPLVVQRSSGQIIGGNGRYEAMRLLGWTKCHVAWVDLDDLGATKLGLMLNRTGDLAETDEDRLGALLRQLQDAGEDISDGWSQKELDELTADLEEVVEDTDEQIDDAMTFSVVVDFDDEEPQIALLKELEERGMQCRLLIT